jgi:aspartyl aminopeptidase
MNDVEVSRELVDFIGRCPSMFHTAATVCELLESAGFARLREEDRWSVEPGGRYYAVRNNSSVVAFRVGTELDDGYHFQIAAAHGDSPTFKVKAVPELEGPGDYLRLNVEVYGGPIDSTWLDRPLGIAGRVLVKTAAGVESRLLHADRDVALIPNLCIHFNREVNDEGKAFNRQIDLCPLFSAGDLKEGAFDQMVADELGVAAGDIMAKDLFLVNRQPGCVWGAANEFVSSPRLDDLQCAFVATKALLAAAPLASGVQVLAVFDNEEVGSNTKQGAMSTFLYDVLTRLNAALGKTVEDYHRAVAKSFLVSCDNAHAQHPNVPEKTDERNCARLNGGPVIKEAANQKYTSDALSRAVFTALCRRAGVPLQTFANRSDVAGGSTLGNLSNTQVSVHAVDIGLPQLAMHSSYETAGVRDTAAGIAALTAFYATPLDVHGADAVSW